MRGWPGATARLRRWRDARSPSCGWTMSCGRCGMIRAGRLDSAGVRSDRRHSSTPISGTAPRGGRMETLTAGAFAAALNRMITTFDEQMETLSRLDAAIGDGDHGISMARGFHSVAERLPAVADRDIGTMAEMVGSSLTGVIGGVTGPVFGTLFSELASQAKGREELDVADLAKAFRRALVAIQGIGQAKVGDKTMV